CARGIYYYGSSPLWYFDVW
nr:immunoglobulin heavy chain junction region [Mus musculus]MBK4184165.1 immunoglobulin heavy chain junction region [Mus musculus]MBK4184166.1 immunoglobulin heavy chain junction region [Mus musculus]MBK4184167.1 immunoglobulin heavy chain junction region [Mus musculus]MBK4184168.1 immunoglobulin heavy chain junction region [Mus musculus]